MYGFLFRGCHSISLCSDAVVFKKDTTLLSTILLHGKELCRTYSGQRNFSVKNVDLVKHSR